MSVRDRPFSCQEVQKMKLRNLVAIVCVGLLLGVEAASAQKVYSLTIKVHPDISLSDAQADRILEDASDLLKTKTGENDFVCNVTFKRKGHVQPLADGTPAIINTRRQLEAVHRQEADIKVVSEINFCLGKEGSFEGCSWPHNLGIHSSIVVHPGSARANLWAHEFGHRTGLRHRTEPGALMSNCTLRSSHVRVTEEECRCFKAGPGAASCRGRPEEPEGATMVCPIVQNDDSPRLAENADGATYLRRLSEWFRSPSP